MRRAWWPAASFVALAFWVMAAQPAAAQPRHVIVQIKLSRQYDLPSPLYVPMQVIVTDPATGKPTTSVIDEVVVRPTNAAGEQVETFTLASDVAGQGGIYSGVVIVPHGGNWTLVAVVRDLPPASGRKAGQAPVIFGQATLDFSVNGGVLQSSAGVADPLRRSLGTGATKYAQGIAVLWVHTLLAMGWAGCVGLIAALAFPRSRQWLSSVGANFADRNLDRLIRATWWLAGLIVATGIYNIVTQLAYKLPLSSSQLSTILKLPYARPYLAAFAVKLSIFAVLLIASVPVMRRARQLATVADLSDPVAPADRDDEQPVRAVPTAAGRRTPAKAASAGKAGNGRTTATLVKPRPRPSLWDDDDDEEDRRLRLARGTGGPVAPAGAFLVGIPGLLLAVTIMKYLHLVIEAFKAR
jgi:hypothetical protein